MKAEDIVGRIIAAYPDAEVETDGADCSFAVTIVSGAFDGLSLIRRQKPVLALFRDELASGELHALSVTARTPAEAHMRR